jgi:hypothetical protein
VRRREITERPLATGPSGRGPHAAKRGSGGSFTIETRPGGRGGQRSARPARGARGGRWTVRGQRTCALRGPPRPRGPSAATARGRRDQEKGSSCGTAPHILTDPPSRAMATTGALCGRPWRPRRSRSRRKGRASRVRALAVGRDHPRTGLSPAFALGWCAETLRLRPGASSTSSATAGMPPAGLAPSRHVTARPPADRPHGAAAGKGCARSRRRLETGRSALPEYTATRYINPDRQQVGERMHPPSHPKRPETDGPQGRRRAGCVSRERRPPGVATRRSPPARGCWRSARSRSNGCRR